MLIFVKCGNWYVSVYGKDDKCAFAMKIQVWVYVCIYTCTNTHIYIHMYIGSGGGDIWGSKCLHWANMSWCLIADTMLNTKLKKIRHISQDMSSKWPTRSHDISRNDIESSLIFHWSVDWIVCVLYAQLTVTQYCNAMDLARHLLRSWIMPALKARCMGPTWGRQDPGGPHVGPMILDIWVTALSHYLN